MTDEPPQPSAMPRPSAPQPAAPGAPRVPGPPRSAPSGAPRPTAPAHIPLEEEVAGRTSEAYEHEIEYFENSSMRELYLDMEVWQQTNDRRLLSITVQRDDGNYCCIALTEPIDDQ